MQHAPYRRIVQGADTAVLMIHGICGTPNHFRGILPLEESVPENWSVYNMVLDGHCKTVRDFGKSSMEKWKAQVWQAFDTLAETHQRVILVSHSMGTLFSIRLSLKHPDKIPVIFLLNVPLRVGLRLFGVRNLLRFPFDIWDLSDPIQVSTKQATGIRMTKKLWQFIPWLPRIVELLREMGEIRNLLSGVSTRCIAFQSERDELVSNRSRKLLEKCGRVEVHNLLHSTHFYYAPEDVAAVQEAFLRACQ